MNKGSTSRRLTILIEMRSFGTLSLSQTQNGNETPLSVWAQMLLRGWPF